jgi:4-hydroxybenzoate polyprenyltransferase/tetratricopeptide (TPR) repeat protein
LKKILERSKIFIESIEEQKHNVFIWLLTLFSIIFARNFLEGVLERGHIIGLSSIPHTSYINFFIHFPFFFVSLLLALTIILRYLTRENIEKILRVIVPFSIIIILPPIIDFIVSNGKGATLSYMISSRDAYLLLTRFFNPFVEIKGLTYGVRIEVFIGCLLTLLYVFIKTKNILKALLGTMGFYLIVVFWASLPVIIANVLHPLLRGEITPVLPYLKIFRSGGLVQTESQKLSLINLFLFVICFLWTFYLYNKKKFISALSNIRPLRSIHYCGMTLFGIFIGYMIFKDTYIFPFSNPFDFLAIVGLMTAMFFIFQCAVTMNDIFDITGDKVSSEKRPLAKGTFTYKEYIVLAIFFFIVSLLFSFSVRPFASILILFFTVLSFIYSAPPLRIKRIFPLSTFTLAFATLISLYLGFSIFAFEKTAYIFPLKITFLILFVFTLSFAVKDIKDYKGDKKMRVFTITTMFGQRKGKFIIAFLMLISYLSVPLITRIYWIFIPSVIIGVFTSVIILSKKPKEGFIFIGYFIFVIVLILSVFLNKDNALKKMTNVSSVDSIGNFHNGERALDRGFPHNAITSYKNAISSGIDSGYLRRRIGYAYLQNSNYNDAIRELEKSREKNPYDPQVYGLLGQAYTKVRRFSNADAIYESAIMRRLLPREMFMLCGERYIESSDTENSIKFLKKAISLGESSGRAYELLGQVFLANNYLYESEEAFEHSIRLNENSSNSYEGLAEVYHRQGETEEALITLKRAILMNPRSYSIHNNLGILYYEKEDYANAIKEFRLALENGADLPEIHTNLGRTYLKSGKIELAQVEFEKALQKDSLDKDAKEGIYIINKLQGG